MRLTADLPTASSGWGNRLPSARYGAIFFLVTILAATLLRYLVFDDDPYQCRAIVTDGQWYLSQWLVPGCTTIDHNAREIQDCAGTEKRKIVLAGDLELQAIYEAIAKRLDRNVKVDLGQEKDLRLEKDHVILEFLWDPYLNRSSLLGHIHDYGLGLARRPLLTVLGAGNTFVENDMADEYALTVKSLASEAYSKVSHKRPGVSLDYTDGPGDLLLFAPATEPYSDHPEDDDKLTAYNNLNSKLADLADDNLIDVLWSFNLMTRGRKDLYDDEGINPAPVISRRKADVLLNLRCTAKIASHGHFPNQAICCAKWRHPNWIQTAFLALAVVVLPVIVLVDFCFPILSDDSRTVTRSLAAFAAIISLQYLVDRTQVFEHTQRLLLVRSNLRNMLILVFIVGAATVRRCKGGRKPNPGEKSPDQPFLPRDQTDEWKGWMQLFIIVYHYNSGWHLDEFWQIIRLCVASYLFLTGFGHTVYFLQKKDYSLKRFTNVMIRTNLIPVALAYVMRTRWLAYYYMPLSTFFFVVLYATLAVAKRYNEHTILLLGKIAASAWIVNAFLETKDLPETVVHFFRITCKLNFDAREFFGHRVGQDRYITHVGMVVAIFYVWAKDVISSDKRQDRLSVVFRKTWPALKYASILTSAVAMAGFFYYTHTHIFNRGGQNAFANVQPYITFAPIIAFTILRNAHPLLRNFHSAAYAWLGRYSGEMYVMQNHLWLANDQTAILRTGFFHGNETVNGDRWRDLVFTTPMYLIACSIIGDATGVLATWFIKEDTAAVQEVKEDPRQDSVAEVEMGLLAGEDVIEGEDVREQMVERHPRPWQRWARFLRVRTVRLWPRRLKYRVILTLVALWALNIMYK